MPVGTVEKIIKEISAAPKQPDVLKIGGAGEPVLHPDFQELMSLLDMLKESAVRTIVYTNGTLFERFSAQDITRWNMHRIVVSVDGIDPESYERIRVGGNYRKLRDLVCDFRDFRDHSSRQKPWIEIRHVTMEDETLKELLCFRRHWVPPGDTVKFQSLNPVGKESRLASALANRAIRRELPIEWNGDVPVVGSVKWFAGNLETQTIEKLWLRVRDSLR
jgi:wyosine [tRNA(Phe)-imidazoG37] synthetase (radical SAM superfamily)